MPKRRPAPPRRASASGAPVWMLTYTDLMTLLLTFFIMLFSMSTIDEQRKHITLGSVIGAFGHGDHGVDALTIKDTRKTVEPGPMENVDSLRTIKDMLWEDLEGDVAFRSNKFIEVLSISDDVLFEPGSTTLSDRGKAILDRMLPVLTRLAHPVLLAGHASVARDELRNFTANLFETGPDFSWKLSLERVMAFHAYLRSRGVPPAMLRVEAFGRFKAIATNTTPEGRRQNRRVDIVLDRRNASWESLLRKSPRPEDRKTMEYGGFQFEFRSPLRREP